MALKYIRGEWSEIVNLGSTIGIDGFWFSPFFRRIKTYLSCKVIAMVQGTHLQLPEAIQCRRKRVAHEKLPSAINTKANDANFLYAVTAFAYLANNRFVRMSLDIYKSKILEEAGVYRREVVS